MKNLVFFLSFVGILTFESCTFNEVDQSVDNDTVSQAFEIKNINFNYNSNDGFYIYNTFQRSFGSNLFDDETILIYRLTDLINSNTPVWQIIPRTIYLSGGREIDYDFDFSKQDFTILASGNFDLELTPEFLDNQTFRIVIVPSNLIFSVDVTNYSEVMKSLNLKENKIQNMDLRVFSN